MTARCVVSLETYLAAHSSVLLLEQRAQLLVQVAGLFRQLRMPQPHPGAGLIDQVNGLWGDD